MKNEGKQLLLEALLPEEKFWEKGDTKHDQLIILGWNMYRKELLRKIRPMKKYEKLVKEIPKYDKKLYNLRLRTVCRADHNWL